MDSYPQLSELFSNQRIDDGHGDVDEEEEEEEEEEFIKRCKVNVRNIPTSLNQQMLSDFLQRQIGLDSIASCEFGPPDVSTTRRGIRFSSNTAVVSFCSLHHAVSAVRLGRMGQLTYYGTKIKVFPYHHEPGHRIRRNRHKPHDFKGSILQMGCLINQDTFCELSGYSNCQVQFDNKISKSLSIIVRKFRDGSPLTYKLKWYYPDLHDIRWCEARRHVDEVTSNIDFVTKNGFRFYNCLMIRVWKAPLVFWLADTNKQKDDEPIWGRAKDFTSRASIGQSFVYCLQFPADGGDQKTLSWSNGADQKKKKELLVTTGFHYSTSILIAPVLHPPVHGLPFAIVFLLNSLVQEGYLSAPSLHDSFYIHLIPTPTVPAEHICHILNLLRRGNDTCFDPLQWYLAELTKFRKLQSAVKMDIKKLTWQPQEDGLMMVRKVFVTPSRVYFTGPEVEVSNRVTRHFREFIDDFLRITFCDEDFGVLPSPALVAPRTCRPQPMDGNGNYLQYTELYHRIIRVLNEGITIADKKFEFLAFSSSQLRENSVWMFASSAKLSAEDIRKWMGDFVGIRNVAKCAARMGQSFSSSTKSLDVPKIDTEEIPDIWNSARTYRFSDGIGKISAEFALKVARKCNIKERGGKAPSLYQIRYGGYKGVVAVDPTSDRKLSFRPSMNKFPSEQISLDILNWSRRMPCYLNREIITLLSTLGIGEGVFERMQGRVVEQLKGMMRKVEVAMEVVEMFSGGDGNREMVAMMGAGFEAGKEPFLRSMLNAFRAVQVTELRKKARIFVSKGRLLMGCMDETGTLGYGEVFVSVSPLKPGLHPTNFSDGLTTRTIRGIDGAPRNACIVEGGVIVAKNPCVHPGDVRVLTAVDVPSLHHLVDCIVFPQKGHRSHPSECSGSDLDGDLYFVSWDKELIPAQSDEPQDYQPSSQSELPRPVTTEDIIRYFAEFMVNNSLGVLCNAHVVFADLEPERARSAPCLALARLCSLAVDFPKTGVAVAIPLELRPTTYPDFMEKNDKSTYKSQNVLGKLFRSLGDVDDEAEKLIFTSREAERFYDNDLEYEGFEEYVEEALSEKICYDEMLLDLMHLYDVKGEAEIFSGNIMSLSKWYRKRPGEAKERIRKALMSIRKEVRTWLHTNINYTVDEEDDEEREELELLAKASAWYHVTYHPRYVAEYVEPGNEHLLSFPWVVYDKLAQIKKLNRRK